MEAKRLITIVSPVYNEELCLLAFEKAVEKILLSREDYDFEILLVDDGSRDNSWNLIEEICRRSACFRGVRLSRNFGSHIAISAGIDQAKGDAVVILACDLQDPLETVLEFIERWKSGVQVVWGARRDRPEGIGRKLVSSFFLSLTKRFAMPRGTKVSTGSFLLMDRIVVDCVREYREHNRITFALVAWTGFEQDEVFYNRQSRYAGESHWTISDMFKAAYSTFIGFSTLPARALTLIGVFTFLLSFCLSAYLITNYFLKDVLVPGWTGLMLTISLLFGVVFMMLGMMSEYLQRIFIESTNRPLYFISKETRSSDERPKDA